MKKKMSCKYRRAPQLVVKLSTESCHENVQISFQCSQMIECVLIDFVHKAWVKACWVHGLRTNRQDSVSDWNVYIGCMLDNAVRKGNQEVVAYFNNIYTHFDGTIGLPVTEKTASPARAWRNIEKGWLGFTFGVIVVMRSALAAFWRVELFIGVRYFDRDECGTGCCCAIRVLPFAALIIIRGPGVITLDVMLEADLLRRRLFKLFKGPRCDTFIDFCLVPESDPDVTRLTSSVMYPYLWSRFESRSLRKCYDRWRMLMFFF